MKPRLRPTILAAVLALALAPPLAVATPPATPSAAQVDALLDAMDLEQGQKEMLDQVGASMDAMVMTGLGPDPDPEDVARMQRINAEQQAVMAEFMQSDHTRNAYRKALRETMTVAEIEAMTAFYRSPDGRSAMQKMPRMMAVAMRELQPAIAGMMARAATKLEAARTQEPDAADD